jgi:hypothetical protein
VRFEHRAQKNAPRDERECHQSDESERWPVVGFEEHVGKEETSEDAERNADESAGQCAFEQNFLHDWYGCSSQIKGVRMQLTVAKRPSTVLTSEGMSRAYRMSVKESLSRHVQVEDGVRSVLELLPILEKERMRELLGEALVARGFQRDGQVAKRTERPGIVTEINLETGEVDVVAEGHLELELVAERHAVGDIDRREEGENKLKAAAREQLEQEASREEATLRKQVTQTLEETLQGLKSELDEVVTQVTAAALKQRAAELGTIEAVHEEENGSLTIRVRV